MGDIQEKEPLQPGSNKSINTIISADKRRSSSGYGSTTLPSSSNSGDFGYEELSNGLTCPTCQGTGKIPRGQEDDLVALIPYRDDRLKPRRTTLYVCIAVFICMAVAGILCAFLIPRPISFVDDHVETISVNLNLTKGKLDLGLLNYLNITNQNFLPLQVTNVSIQVVSTFKGHVITAKKVQIIPLTVPLRSKQRFPVAVNVTIDNDDFPLTYCDPNRGGNGIYMIFSTTIYYHFMFQNSQSSLTHYQLVSCTMPQHGHRNQIEKRSIRNRLDWGAIVR